MVETPVALSTSAPMQVVASKEVPSNDNVDYFVPTNELEEVLFGRRMVEVPKKLTLKRQRDEIDDDDEAEREKTRQRVSIIKNYKVQI